MNQSINMVEPEVWSSSEDEEEGPHQTQQAQQASQRRTLNPSNKYHTRSPPIRHEVNLITLDDTPKKNKARIDYLERKYKKCKDERDSLIKKQHSQERTWKNRIKIMKTAHLRQLEEVKTIVEGQEKGNTDQKNQYKETKKKEANKENKTDATAHKQELIWKEEEKEKSRQKKEEEDSEDDQQVDQYRKPTPQRPERTETRRCTPPPTLLLPTREHDVGSETMEPKDSTVHSARLEEESSPEPDRDTPTSFCIPRRPAIITTLTTLLFIFLFGAGSVGPSGISQIPDLIGEPSGILLHILALAYACINYSKHRKKRPFRVHLRSGIQEQEQAQEPSPDPTLETGKMDRDKVSGDIERPQSQTLGQLMTDLIPTYNKVW